MLAALALVTITVTAAALVAFSMTTAALTITVTALTLMLLMSMAGAIALTLIAISAATATAGATHLLSHRFRDLFIRGSTALFNGDNQILVHHGKQFVELLTRLKKALAHGIVNHILTQPVKGSDFFIRGGHALHVLVAQLLAIFVDLAEKIRSFRILIKEPDSGLGGNHFLALSKGVGQLGCELHQFRSEGSI